MIAATCTELVLNDLQQWSVETDTPLIVDPQEIAWRERCGAVVDLHTGLAFYQYDNYVDFARRWSDYRRVRGLVLDPQALVAALRAAFGSIYPNYPASIWQLIANKTLET